MHEISMAALIQLLNKSKLINVHCKSFIWIVCNYFNIFHACFHISQRNENCLHRFLISLYRVNGILFLRWINCRATLAAQCATKTPLLVQLFNQVPFNKNFWNFLRMHRPHSPVSLLISSPFLFRLCSNYNFVFLIPFPVTSNSMTHTSFLSDVSVYKPNSTCMKSFFVAVICFS